ncbi:hypothetical protein AVEN_275173-1, partial [Araneus ventricosus]
TQNGKSKEVILLYTVGRRLLNGQFLLQNCLGWCPRQEWPRIQGQWMSNPVHAAPVCFGSLGALPF